jgi:hypothetical protein
MVACGVIVSLLGALGCVSGKHRPVSLDSRELQQGIERLSGPLPGYPVAMYRMEVRQTGGLRLVVQTAPDGGRFLFSEPFGAAVALTVWDPSGAFRVYDLKRGCRVDGGGIGVLDLTQVSHSGVVRLLTGRLPDSRDGRICRAVGPSDMNDVMGGDGWCTAVITPDPWRVVRVGGGTGEDSWEVELGDHTASVPGHVRVSWGDGQWAELALVRLKWDSLSALPPEPALDWCDPDES